ncbi:hypothetical protein [Sphingobacterium kitahiroshimense]|uniref:hypothetical protein n=1 Tax=Sphingobacterium kitahiroshimense TaxID=470446 RepID=UPI003207C06F
MLKNSKRESYALSPEEEMCLYVGQNRVVDFKNQHMITDLPDLILKKVPDESCDIPLNATGLQSLLPLEQTNRYYSLLIRAEGEESAYSAVIKNDRSDTLRISLVNMAIYECYLFALGLPLNFPPERILVLGCERNTYLPDEHIMVPELYSYELVVPASTEREEYRQRILNDLDAHFKLEVRAEMLQVVKGSRALEHEDHEDVEIIWDEQLMMIMKTKIGAKIGKTYPIVAMNN